MAVGQKLLVEEVVRDIVLVLVRSVVIVVDGHGGSGSGSSGGILLVFNKGTKAKADLQREGCLREEGVVRGRGCDVLVGWTRGRENEGRDRDRDRDNDLFLFVVEVFITAQLHGGRRIEQDVTCEARTRTVKAGTSR